MMVNFPFVQQRPRRRWVVLVGNVIETQRWKSYMYYKLSWVMGRTKEWATYTMPWAPHCAWRAIPRLCNSLPRPSTPDRTKCEPCCLEVRLSTCFPVILLTKKSAQPSSSSQSLLTANLHGINLHFWIKIPRLTWRQHHRAYMLQDCFPGTPFPHPSA